MRLGLGFSFFFFFSFRLCSAVGLEGLCIAVSGIMGISSTARSHKSVPWHLRISIPFPLFLSTSLIFRKERVVWGYCLPCFYTALGSDLELGGRCAIVFWVVEGEGIKGGVISGWILGLRGTKISATKTFNFDYQVAKGTDKG